MIALDSCVALHPLKPESKENTLTLKKLVIVFLIASQPNATSYKILAKEQGI